MASPFPPQIQIGGADPAAQADPEQQIRDAIDQIRSAVAADGLDDQEKLILEQITTLGQKLLANRQSQAEAAMGTTPAHKAMARSYGG